MITAFLFSFISHVYIVRRRLSCFVVYFQTSFKELNEICYARQSVRRLSI